LDNWLSVDQELAYELGIDYIECWNCSCEKNHYIIILDFLLMQYK